MLQVSLRRALSYMKLTLLQYDSRMEKNVSKEIIDMTSIDIVTPKKKKKRNTDAMYLLILFLLMKLYPA